MRKLAVFVAAMAVCLPVSGYAQVAGWVLALSWQPGFCATHRVRHECDGAVLPELTLHGLWPELAGREGDACAPDSAQTGDWCDLPAPEISAGTRRALRQVMPGTIDCLERHEWQRHGICSGRSAEDYFATAIRLTKAVNAAPVADVLRSARGKEVTRDTLETALAKAGGQARLICHRDRGRTHLVAIEWTIAPGDLDRFPLPGAGGRPETRGCPARSPIEVD